MNNFGNVVIVPSSTIQDPTMKKESALKQKFILKYGGVMTLS